MAETVMPTVVVRRFRWRDLHPDHGQTMIELVRSLGLDPDYVADAFAISRVGERPWRLHLTQHQHDESGRIVLDVAADDVDRRALVFDGIDLPAFLLTTTEEPTDA